MEDSDSEKDCRTKAALTIFTNNDSSAASYFLPLSNLKSKICNSKSSPYFKYYMFIYFIGENPVISLENDIFFLVAFLSELGDVHEWIFDKKKTDLTKKSFDNLVKFMNSKTGSAILEMKRNKEEK